MEAKEYKPRLTIEVTEEQQRTIKKFCPYGMQKQVLGVIIDDVVKMLEEFGGDFITAILSRKYSMRGYMDGDDEELEEPFDFRTGREGKTEPYSRN